MKKIFILLCVLAQFLGIVNAYSQWDGTTKNVTWYTGHESDATYTINTADQLAGLSSLVRDGGVDFEGKTIFIGSDPSSPVTIDLGGNIWTPIGNSTTPFKGRVDGNNCTIKNFRFSAGTEYCGLFGYVRSYVDNGGVAIRNINVEADNLSGKRYVGGICGYICGLSSHNAKIANCTFKGKVKASGTHLGGIVGYATYAVIDSCAVAGEVDGTTYVGGIAGYVKGYSTTTSSKKFKVRNCVNSAKVHGSEDYVGGIVGYAYRAIIEYSVNGGGVYCSGVSTGGIAGTSATGSDSGATNFNCCLNVGWVSNGGAILGAYTNAIVMEYCYYDNQTTGLSNGVYNIDDEAGQYEGFTTGGLIGSALNSPGYTGDWPSAYHFDDNSYPIPNPLVSSDFGKVTSAFINFNFSTYNNMTRVTENFVLCPEADWSVVNSTVNPDFITITITSGVYTAVVDGDPGIATLTATVGNVSKNILIDTYSSDDDLSILSIENVEELQQFRDAVNGVTDNYKGIPNTGFQRYTFEITNDIDLSGISNWEPIGTQTHPFSGFVVGGNHVISGLNIVASDGYKGLFGYLQAGSISMLTVEGSVTGTQYLGGICGYMKGSGTDAFASIEDCHFVGTVTTTYTSTSAYVGGVCGYAGLYSQIQYCSATGSVVSPNKATSCIGGIAGYLYGVNSDSEDRISFLNGCINLANVKGKGSVGGILGYLNDHADMSYNLNAGNVECNEASAGGILGKCNGNDVSVSENITTGTVEGNLSASSVIGEGNIEVATYNYYDNQRSLLLGINAADEDGRAIGQATSALSGSSILSGLSLTEWTETAGYPLPTGFTEDEVGGLVGTVASSTAKIADGQKYNMVTSNVTLSDYVSWESSNTEVITSGGAVPEPLNYGSVDLVASKDYGETGISVSKNVKISVAEDEDPLIIENYEDLKLFRDAVNQGDEGSYKGHRNVNGFTGVNFKVEGNIDMTDAENPWVAIGTSTNPFKGNFDGGSGEGYKFTGITVSTTSSYAGLFGYVYSTASSLTIKNIDLSGTISAKTSSGAIVGYARGTNDEKYVEIKNCHFNGSLLSPAGSNVGGICGYSYGYTHILDCTTAGTISGSSFVGGICGKAERSTQISGCASLSKELKGAGNTIGGIVGSASNTEVSYCVNAAIVSGASPVGGIAGKLIAGASLNECLNFITAGRIGKIYGEDDGSATITSCYYDSRHCALGEDNGEGKTTAEMQALTSELTTAKWTTYTGSYPIPINIASYQAAKVACAPVYLAGDEDNQHVQSSYTVCTNEGIEWSMTVYPEGYEYVTYSTGAVTISRTEFDQIVMTASLGGYEKLVYLTNSAHNPPLTIDSKDDLLAFCTAVNDGTSYKETPNVDGFANKTFVVTVDIALTSKWSNSIGKPNGHAFKGTFDGGNHKISNLYATSGTPRGLFGYIDGATIKRINVTTGSNTLIATTTCGGIVANAVNSIVDSCTFNGKITATGNNIGGIVGKMESTEVTRCAVSGVISSSTSLNVGGICGYVTSSSTIESCVNDMDVNGASSIGGIVGFIANSSVQNCINAGKIVGTAEGEKSNGGIAGYADELANITDNLNAGTVYGQGGGVVGYKHGDATVAGNYFDNLRNDLHGIGDSESDTGAEGNITADLITGSFGLLDGWTESAGMYPVPAAIANMDATKLAAVPVNLDGHKYNKVNTTFYLGTIEGLVWTFALDEPDIDGDGINYVDVSGTTVIVDDESNTAIFTATYNGWQKNVLVSNSAIEDPLIIATIEQFKQFQRAVNAGSTGAYKGVPNVNGFAGKRFKLVVDINLDGESNWEPIGISSTCPFSGEFDGNGSKVVKLKVDDASNSYKGLFGYVVGGSIKDLHVEGNVSGKSYVGGICGYIKGASEDSYSAITKCTFNGSVSAAVSYAGGIAGSNNYYTVIDRCRVAGSVSAITSYSGGITGYSISVSGKLDTISNCTNAAAVSSLDLVGGIAGMDKYSVIEYCNNGGNVSGETYKSGGIVGHNVSSKVLYCISTGLVLPSIDEGDESAVDGGAVVGYFQSGTMSYNFYDKQRNSVKGGSPNTTGISSDVANKYVGQLTSAMTGSSPTGFVGDNWGPMYWRFTDGLYPIPAALEEDDEFAIVAATPVFLADAENWKNVHTNFTLGTPASVSWESSNDDFINVETSYPTAIVDNDADDRNSAVLTATINAISKKFVLKDFGFISVLSIENLEELKEFRDAVNNRVDGAYKGVLNVDGYKGVTFHLDEDNSETFDLSGENWIPIGKSNSNCFAGYFEGHSNEIKNLTINDCADGNAGLFGYVYCGTIKDLKLTDVNIDITGSKVGALCGTIEGTATDTVFIENCEAVGLITTTGDTVGGLVGYVWKYSKVEDCVSSVDVSAASEAGGIAGHVNSNKLTLDIIVNCENNGSVNTTGSYGGGIVGYYLNGGNIVGCTNNGDITSGASYAGGIVGLEKGYSSSLPCIITECRNDGLVNATTSYAGGIAGKLDVYTSISNSINRGDVTAGTSYAGGIVGLEKGASTYPCIISECRNDGLVKATTSYAGGIAGKLDVYSEVGTSVNSGDVKSGTYVGGIAGCSKTTSGTNRIAYCTNSAKVEQTTTSSSKYVAGICASNYRTEINYCNNGGNVKGKTAAYIGGIAGYVGNSDDASSSLLCNINTGTVTPASANNGIFGTNYGTVTTSFYDKQRTNSTSADGEYTSNLIGASPSAFDGVEGWTDENFVFAANMYPMPKGTEAYPEAKLAATPVIFNETEVFDSVLNDFTVVTENSVSWTSSDEEYVGISGDNASVLRFKCTEKFNDTLTASLTDEVTLEKVVVLNLSKVRVSHNVAYGDSYYLWTGAATDINWADPQPKKYWLEYNGERFVNASVAPTSGNVVFIPQDDVNCVFYSPVLTADKSVSNIVVAEGFGLGTESHTITVSGTATIGGSVIGNVTFEDGATCDDTDGYIDGVITKRGAGTFKFLTGHFDDSEGRNFLLQSAFEMTVVGDDAEVAVHYTTDHETYPMPDSYSHGGNMGGELDHVSDRDFWHVRTNKTLTDVTLYWRNRESGINLETDDCELDYMRLAYVTAGGSMWNEVSGTTDGNCQTGYIKIDALGASRAVEQEFDVTLGSTDGNGKDLVLPIELVSFTATCDGYLINVNWATASEKNSDYFILEKSYDAVNFTGIARIDGADNSIEMKNYTFTDYENYGGQMYYRLLHFDYDGAHSVSEMIEVKCADYELEPAVAVFPNPFISDFTLSLENFGNKPATVEVFDIMGTLVRTMNIDATGNSYETVLNLGELSSATYTIRISTADFVINKRIVKQ